MHQKAAKVLLTTLAIQTDSTFRAKVVHFLGLQWYISWCSHLPPLPASYAYVTSPVGDCRQADESHQVVMYNPRRISGVFRVLMKRISCSDYGFIGKKSLKVTMELLLQFFSISIIIITRYLCWFDM